jgi:GNAT superfamily N-acetyltransferase
MQIVESEFDGYFISTDRSKLDIAAIHDFLANHSGWSNDIPSATVAAAIENSLNFGVYYQGRQVGFARVISDFATIAYLGDVYVLSEHRGKGVSKKLMDTIMAHPNLQGLRRWILLTSTADWLYSKYNFTPLPKPELYMELYNPEVYKKKKELDG